LSIVITPLVVILAVTPFYKKNNQKKIGKKILEAKWLLLVENLVPPSVQIPFCFAALPALQMV